MFFIQFMHLIYDPPIKKYSQRRLSDLPAGKYLFLQVNTIFKFQVLPSSQDKVAAYVDS